jgi:hypothetical protein
MILRARWLVPEMVKTGLGPSFAYWRLIWACLTGNLGRVEGWQLTGVPTNPEGSRAFP